MDFKDQDIPDNAKSKKIVQIILDELTMHKELFKGVVDSTDFSSYNGENVEVKNILINTIFPFIKHYKAEISEKKRYQRMLDSLESNKLTTTDKIVINAYSRVPDVNDFLLDLANNNGQKYAKAPFLAKRKIFKTQALLLQNALRKLTPHSPSLLIRADTVWTDGGKDPFAGKSREVFDKFTSTMDVSELTKSAVEDEFKKIGGMKKGPRIRMEFVNTKQGYEIAPWVKTNYIFQREVLLPVGASYTPRDINDKTEFKYSDYKFVYEMRDQI